MTGACVTVVPERLINADAHGWRLPAYTKLRAMTPSRQVSRGASRHAGQREWRASDWPARGSGGGEGGVARASGLSGLTYMDGACEQTLPTETYVAALAGVPTWLRATGQRSRADDQIMPPGRAW